MNKEIKKRTKLLIIDPQIDFCDPKGALYVPGADKDMERLSKLVDKIYPKLNDIYITLDSHHPMHVSHPIFWLDKQGNHPDPFTIISYKDVKQNKWVPFNRLFYDRMLKYTKQLEENNKYDLCIWPPHCLIGGSGIAIYPELFDSIRNWEENKKAVVHHINKGDNIFTEHYSAVKAEISLKECPSTFSNSIFKKMFQHSDMILIAGEAGSHCVATTVNDIYDELDNKDLFKKAVLLVDSISPVKSFEKLQKDFIDSMKEKGLQIAKTTDF